MDINTSRTWAEISLDNIEHNYRAMRALLPDGCRFLGVVKADAYGHGALPVARRLAAVGCDWLAVAALTEALELRAGGVTLPILILGPVAPGFARLEAENGVTQAVSSEEQALRISEELRGSGLTLNVHMKADSGMGRTGFRAGDPEAIKALARAATLPGIAAGGIFTHFAVSDSYGDEFTQEQFQRFMATVSGAEALMGRRFGIRHCVNSGAMINYRELCLDMVRPGLALYGMYPAAEKGGVDLLPAMALKTRVTAVTEHLPGDTVSYGRTFTVRRPTRLAVLPIGYADGLHRLLSNRMELLINGTRVPQVGRICMDMCMADVTELPDCRVGDLATVFGAGLPIEEQAEKAETISYELVCAVAKRVPRVYVGG